MIAPPVKGEIRNPKGGPSHRQRLATEIAKRAGLEELALLAFKVKARKGQVAEALIETACDRDARGHVVAQRLLWDLLGIAGEDDAKATLEVEVRRKRKVRVMEMEPEDEPHEVIPESNGHTSQGNGHVSSETT